MPRVGTLHHPTVLEWSQACGPCWPRVHLDAPRRALCAPPGGKPMMVILVVGNERCTTGNIVRRDPLEPWWGGDPSIPPRARDQDDPQPAQGLHPQRALAPCDLLAAIIAALAPAPLRRLDGLAVDPRRPGRGLPTHGPAGLGSPPLQPRGPRAVVAPPGPVVVHGALGQQSMREHRPWTPAPMQRHDRMPSCPHGHWAWASPALGVGRGNHRGQERPLSVRQIRGRRFPCLPCR
jgi:hypothetical protein